jgi:hypothetical protein
LTKYQVSHEEYSELRDVVSATMCRSQEGQLSRSHSTVLLLSSEDDNMAFAHGILLHLAKDLQATFIPVDLGELEDLGWDFDRQEQQMLGAKESKKSELNEKSGSNPATEMAVHYFGARCEGNASKSSGDRTNKAIKSILDAQSAKSQQHITDEEIQHAISISSSKINTTDLPPLLFYYQSASEVLETQRDLHFDLLKNFQKCIQDRRMLGQSVVLLISLPNRNTSENNGDDDDDCDSWYRKRRQQELKKKIFINKASTVSITPSIIKRESVLNTNNYTDRVNIRRLKRLLEGRIRHLLVPEVIEALQRSSPWATQWFDGNYRLTKSSLWTEDDFQAAYTQIIGHAFRKPYISLQDIGYVLCRMGLCEIVDRPKANVPENKSQEAERVVHSMKLKRIKSNANQFEKGLISCIINPGN